MKREELTKEYLETLFDYNREEGTLFWKVGRRKGYQVKTKCHSGYRANIHGMMVQVSHIIWMLEYGEFPTTRLLHSNGDCLDNRVENLRKGCIQSHNKEYNLTQEILIAQMSYCPETGEFTSVHGNKIGYLCKDGYIQITLADGSQRKAHRLAWLYMTGKMPSGILDHIDGDRTNNKWDNLREVTYSQNAMNSRFRKNNTSGYKGVSFDKRLKRYEAYIWKENKKRSLGFYRNPEEAYDAYLKASEVMHGEYARQ